MAKYEHELSALEGLGLSDIEIDASLTYVLGFVQGWARTAADARAPQDDTGMDDEQWWAANAPLLAQILDNHAYPNLQSDRITRLAERPREYARLDAALSYPGVVRCPRQERPRSRSSPAPTSRTCCR
jgi:hypothetical protein